MIDNYQELEVLGQIRLSINDCMHMPHCGCLWPVESLP